MRFIAWGIAGVVAIMAATFAFRWLGVLVILGGTLALMFRQSLRCRRGAAIVLGGFLSCSSLPFDISLRVRPGLPRLVSVVYGYARSEDFERQKKGEIILGGCVVTGYDPLWLIVW